MSPHCTAASRTNAEVATRECPFFTKPLLQSSKETTVLSVTVEDRGDKPAVYAANGR